MEERLGNFPTSVTAVVRGHGRCKLIDGRIACAIAGQLIELRLAEPKPGTVVASGDRHTRIVGVLEGGKTPLTSRASWIEYKGSEFSRFAIVRRSRANEFRQFPGVGPDAATRVTEVDLLPGEGAGG